jgi:predicted transcriptional regulator with HTH domain
VEEFIMGKLSQMSRYRDHRQLVRMGLVKKMSDEEFKKIKLLKKLLKSSQVTVNGLAVDVSN